MFHTWSIWASLSPHARHVVPTVVWHAVTRGRRAWALIVFWRHRGRTWGTAREDLPRKYGYVDPKCCNTAVRLSMLSGCVWKWGSKELFLEMMVTFDLNEPNLGCFVITSTTQSTQHEGNRTCCSFVWDCSEDLQPSRSPGKTEADIFTHTHTHTLHITVGPLWMRFH